MEKLPHHYYVSLKADDQPDIKVESPGLGMIRSAAPIQFGGPGNLWSPETLLVAAVADCLALTFKSVAKAISLKWTTFTCNAEGTLDRTEGVTRFTAIDLHVNLAVPPETDHERARAALERAERGCLIGNSLRFAPVLHAEVVEEVNCGESLGGGVLAY